MKKLYFIPADSQTKSKFILLVGFIATIRRSLRRGACPERSRRVHLPYRYSTLLVPCTLFLFLFLFASCENDPKIIELWTKKADLKEEAKHIESYLSQSGVMKAKLTAP